MVVLVTGAKGMLGQDLCPILEDSGFDVIETDMYNLDITDELAVNRFIAETKPDFIIHCAAYTDVDKAEEDFKTAELVNVKGTEYLSKAAARNNATLVFISTDYVFDGTKGSPYLPNDKPNPINNYGLTKLKGEEAVIKYCEKYFIIRTSWLYGHHGKNFVETMISLKDKELKVVDDQIGCPTWTVELSNGIVKLINQGIYGTYHVCGSGKTTWYRFAKKIFELMKLEVNLLPIKTLEFPSSVKRPAYSVMDNNNILRKWEVALNDYLALRIDE